ncbi:SDR family NAD(P)-dependent oxidoreductase [Chitinophaga pinensis]|uniref:KR domain protein n=1 Tax=Chitinophaga pinensis (strain ATCC 43595 / DSM 2588 / LMG 13176 / NBRC 15968 / NCIMB 11800 / UQM 2034) TaxID=485918 RepID=A0A979G8P9_CHIPD|nr:SDR family NAD(P)-dependent oxidoreductase [Chitinophaga pinensis]ACU62728.1 KR domain protein [Chitinophaga pinensis DSM 2588]
MEKRIVYAPLIDAVLQTAERHPNKVLFVFREGRNTVAAVTGRELSEGVAAAGTVLQQSLSAQERVLLILPQGIDFIYSLLACFYANVVAIPVPAADPRQPDLVQRTLSLLEHAAASTIITTGSFHERLAESMELDSVTLLDVQELVTSGKEPLPAKEITTDDLALLFYTSGSTSAPKGVMTTHAQLFAQADAGREQWKITDHSCIISWMPQFHNLGLNFGILAPLISGASSVLSAPGGFAASPEDWFYSITLFQGTHTAAPNFAFDLACNMVGENVLTEVELSSLEAIVCGGEPVRKATYDAFFNKFSAAGLRQHVFCPHYGLSETGSASTIVPGEGIRTLSLDIAALEEGKIVYSNGEKQKDIISCGPVPEGAIILCVDPVTGEPCAAGVVGEIWLRTPGTASGYFQLPEETTATFGAVMPERADIRFLRTGDLGFIEDNHLYITGRLKEIIIVNGKNYHPVDIEWTVKKYLSQLTLPLAVFADEQDGRERVVVVQEVAADKPAAYYESVSIEILAAVAEVHTLDVSRIILAAPGSIPRTASGKVQRRACREAFKKGQLTALFEFTTGHTVTAEKETSYAPVDLRLVTEVLQKQVFHDIPGVDASRLAGLKIWGELGLNSLQYVSIAQRIAAAFDKPFAPPMLFKYRNVGQLASYLYPQGMEAVTVTANRHSEPQHTEKHQYNQKDIAIIGMHCELPGGVNSPADLWQLLTEGRDAIRPEGAGQRLESAFNWTSEDFPQFGGYLENVAGFDHTFFHISPLEAESMDPQQRKALELSWHVLEHGGYDPYTLSGAAMGVYLGVHNNDYAELAATQTDAMTTYGAFLDSGLHPTMIANRVSRWFDFHGPSEVINTACSSSLVAVHHAVNAIRSGNCSMAIAGGINIMLTPRISRASHQAGMLSPDGRCKTFDEKADGFVRAEGLGAVLMKPLYQAEQDGDTIYGVIRGTAVNHDGKSNSLRAPNLVAQKQVISAALTDAAIPAASISYIETHGTGTALGDPIEVQALREAFEDDQAKGTAFCGLGTVKTNIGHCESAAGIAGLLKLLLSMQHQQLPGILHFNQLNPFLDIAGSPFYIADTTQQWQRQHDEQGNELPLRAGVSSFGFGGVNAHVILEEYVGTEKRITAGVNGMQIVPLSARHKEQVQLLATGLLEQLRHADKGTLASVAYTLQTGRAAMESRVVFIVSDMESLINGLQAFLQGEPSPFYLEGQQTTSAMLSADDEDVLALLQQWFRKGKPEKIAAYWINGGHVAWKALYEEQTPLRTALPLYPFRKDRHWLRPAEVHTLKTTQLHPLLHENISDFYGQRFRSSFTGNEYYFSEHIIHQHKTLPAAAYIEMIREALQRSAQETGAVVIEDICWLRPLYATDVVDVIIHLEAAHDTFNFKVCSEVNEAIVVYCHGKAHFETTVDTVIDLGELRINCNDAMISSETYYNTFRKAGIVYGPAFSRIAVAYAGQRQVFASLAALSSGPASTNAYGVSPVMLDAALQSVTALDFQYFLPEGAPAAIPFAINALTVYKPADQLSFAWARYNDAGTIDIDVCDEGGKVGISIRGLQLVKPESLPVVDKETLLFAPVWKEETRVVTSRLPDRRIVWLSQEIGIYEEAVRAVLPESEVILLVSPSADTAERLTDYTVLLLQRIQQLLQDKETGKTFLQIILPDDNNSHLYSSLAAMLKTLQAEQPSISGQLIITDNPKEITKVLQVENSADDHVSIRYQQGVRKVQAWEEQPTTVAPIVWKEHGIYLITGGAGSIGRVFLEEISSKLQQAVVYISGRSPIAANALTAFEKPGLSVIYKQTDITDQQQVASLIKEIRMTHGTLNGIIHSAGLIRDNYIFNKDLKEVPAVLAPKVGGIIALDEATKDLPLDFMVFFSSVAGSLGSAGQADYAVANAFMDQYAVFRNRLCHRGERTGRTLSVNWPLWEAGGMKMEEAVQQQLYATTGMLAMSSAVGLHAFYRAMELPYDQVMVLSGERRRLLEMIHRERKNQDQRTATTTAQEIPALQLEDKAIEFFTGIVADALHQPKGLIDADASLDKYGIDSVLITVLTGKLEKHFGPVSKTLFFEYQDLRSLTRYFLQTYKERLSALLTTAGEAHTVKEISVSPVSVSPGAGRFLTRTPPSSKEKDIAVIGLAGKYAGADNINEFWDNLREGRNCITEVPAERWDWRTYFDPKRGKKASMYTRWGGFIKDIDKFDPLFFHISPVEAERMDPQERLFLEQVYAAIEDAAYTPANLNSKRSVGVFAGVMHGLYATEAAYWSIANRVSYLFNFNGPSLAIDTACSASLTAIHLAVQSIRSGACECAIAGGVNLVTHPQHFIGLSEMTMVSSSDACRSFGVDADGFVDGEGVGAIVLKPLQQAIEDGDHIYGVIRGTAINSGGKTNGFTVPNPVAQAQVVSAALKDAGISARSVSYIEAHGTGTALGDPIEINGLSRAFDQDTNDRQYCAIGSVKSNIGHCESAAGIAGLSKILLQMKHGLLVPSLHATATNPNIDFNATPFCLQQSLAPWTGKRIAGISSFGAGGSNAHLIIEAYTPVNSTVLSENTPVIIVLSGRTPDRLQELAMNLLLALSGEDAPTDLRAIAFTLQTGREAMEERLAMVVASIEELKTRLTLFLAGDTAECFTGQASNGKVAADEWKHRHDADADLRRWMQDKDYIQLCQWWVKGLAIDWNGLYNTQHPERISLPGYPFARERYWLENKENDPLAQLLDDMLNDNISIAAAAATIRNAN